MRNARPARAKTRALRPRARQLAPALRKTAAGRGEGAAGWRLAPRGRCYNRVVSSTPPTRFVVTGGAGFIGSHLVDRLLRDHPDGVVTVFDDFSTGNLANLAAAQAAGDRLRIVRGNVRDLAALEQAAAGAGVIFHQAAL